MVGYIQEFAMIKRSLIERTCLECNNTCLVRKDGVGIYCRSCRAKLNHRDRNSIDMVGYVSGKLVVIEFAFKRSREYFWKCLCECGRYITTRGFSLRKSKTKSCGC